MDQLVIRQFFPAYELQALCKFSGIRYTLENCRYPKVESTGMLPQVQHKSVLVGGDAAVQFLRTLTELNASLSSIELAYSLGLLDLVHWTLGSVEQWSLNICDGRRGRNAAESIYKVTPFPFSLLFVYGLRYNSKTYLHKMGMTNESWVKEQAEKAYKALEAVLIANGGPYFFGSS